MADSTIITGQFVRISQTPASIGERILASIIDMILLCLYLSGSISLILDSKLHLLQGLNLFIVLFFFYIPMLAYPLLCETFNNGQSLGKKLLNIRVVKTDGSRPGISSYLLRWLLLPIDTLLSGGLGALVMILNKNNQRLGDLAGGTMVVKEKDYRKIHVSLDEFDYLTKNYRPIYPQAADLSLEQVNVITRTLQSESKERMRRITMLARKVCEALTVTPRSNNAEDFLQTILRDYQYYALEEI